MTVSPRIERRASVCPHDCPSACSLDVEVIDGRSIGRVHGAQTNRYTNNRTGTTTRTIRTDEGSAVTRRGPGGGNRRRVAG